MRRRRIRGLLLFGWEYRPDVVYRQTDLLLDSLLILPLALSSQTGPCLQIETSTGLNFQSSPGRVTLQICRFDKRSYRSWHAIIIEAETLRLSLLPLFAPLYFSTSLPLSPPLDLPHPIRLCPARVYQARDGRSVATLLSLTFLSHFDLDLGLSSPLNYLLSTRDLEYPLEHFT